MVKVGFKQRKALIHGLVNIYKYNYPIPSIQQSTSLEMQLVTRGGMIEFQRVE